MGRRRLKDHSGYLIVDHSDSPGISMSDIPARLRGLTIPVGNGEIFEADIQFCAHCGSQVVLHPKRVRPRGFCARCNHYVCDNPVCSRECNPLKKQFDLLGG